jgi:hypothetical protein
MKKISIGILALTGALAFGSLCNAQALKKEPGAGQLPAGHVNLQ